MIKIDTIGSRVKYLRKDILKLNQTEFSERLMLSQTFLANLEKGTRNFTDRTIADICREFNVNEEWLRTGNGEIFIESEKHIVDEFLKTHNLNEKALGIVYGFLSLNEKERDIFVDGFYKILEKSKSFSDANMFEKVHNEQTNVPNIQVLEPNKEEPTYNVFTASRSTNDEVMKNVQVPETEYFNLLNELESAPGVTSEKDL